MRYRDAGRAVRAWNDGENVMRTMRQARGLTQNTPDIIALSYDLQAGSYVRFHDEHRGRLMRYAAECASHLAPLVEVGTTLLDVGAGELTTLAAVVSRLPRQPATTLACDLSWSRLRVGQEHVTSRPDDAAVHGGVTCFVAEAARLPLADASVDVVTTFHSLEPNRGREVELVSELVRVAGSWLVMFEPSYESADEQGRRRMDELGYVRGLADAVEAASAELVSSRVIAHPLNPLNPTVVHVVRPRPEPVPARRSAPSASEVGWSCPVTRTPLRAVHDQGGSWWWSEEAYLLYPVVGGIPLLTEDSAVFASRGGEGGTGPGGRPPGGR